MIKRHIIPFLNGRKINEIQASDIIKWQNKIIKQGYSECYNRMLNYQINAIFTHASIIYDLKSSKSCFESAFTLIFLLHLYYCFFINSIIQYF